MNWNIFKKTEKSLSTSILSMLPQGSRTGLNVSKMELVAAFKKWVYCCITKNADALASVNLKLLSFSGYKEKNLFPGKTIHKSKFNHDNSLKQNVRFKVSVSKEVEELYTHPFLALLEKPNNYDSQYEFMYKIVVNLELTGNAYLLLNKTGEIITSLNVLHSQYIQPDTLDGNIVKGYYYSFGIRTYYYTPEQIISISYYNPLNDIEGFAPLNAVYSQYLLDNSFDDYQLSINDNAGIPSGVIKYNAKALNEKERDILEEQWNKTMRGIYNTGKIKVIGNDFSFEKLGMDAKELDFINGRRVTKEAICAAFGLPLPFIDAKDTNRASFDTALYQYQKFTILPKIKQIVDSFNSKVISLYNEPNIWLTYENPVEEEKKQYIADTLLLLDKGILTVEDVKLRLENE